MKNTLTIDMTNSYAVDMLSNVDAGVGVNRVYIELKCDVTKTNTIRFGGTTYTATGDDYIIEIPQAQWVGTGDLSVVLSNGVTSRTLTIHKLRLIDASVFLKRISDTEYNFKTAKNPTEATVESQQIEINSLKTRMGAAENVNAEQTRDIQTNATNIGTNSSNITALQNGKIDKTEKGAVNGVATLNSAGKVPESQLPSYVDDVLEYASRSMFPGTGETGKIYVALDTNILYRWGGTTYIEISEPDIATPSKAGIVKPDGESITVGADGTIHANSGHTIIDEDGTAMDKQSGLQFLNSVVENDPTNHRTIITPKGKADYVFQTYAEMMTAISGGLVEPNSTIFVMEDQRVVVCSADAVSYDGTNSGLSATDVQGAIDETVSMIHGDISALNADDIGFDGTASGMTADDVQEAIDENHTAIQTKEDKTGNVFYGSTAASTKIKIKINAKTGWMLNFTVVLYQSYRATKVMISGYNYGSNHWYSPSASILGDSSSGSISVYFGYDADYELWVGFDGASYTGIAITDVCNGYVQVPRSDMFTISYVSSLATLQTTVTAINNGIKSITRSGTTFTATRCDGSTFTFTQQDNNTTTGTSYAAGSCPNNTTFATNGSIANLYPIARHGTWEWISDITPSKTSLSYKAANYQLMYFELFVSWNNNPFVVSSLIIPSVRLQQATRWWRFNGGFSTDSIDGQLNIGYTGASSPTVYVGNSATGSYSTTNGYTFGVWGVY